MSAILSDDEHVFVGYGYSNRVVAFFQHWNSRFPQPASDGRVWNLLLSATLIVAPVGTLQRTLNEVGDYAKSRFPGLVYISRAIRQQWIGVVVCNGLFCCQAASHEELFALPRR